MKVLLCSYFKYPNGDAGSVRHEKFAMMFQQLNCEVLVVGLGKYCDFQINIENGINYTSLRSADHGFWSKVKSRICFWSNLKKQIEEFVPDVILMDDLRPRVTIHLKHYCQKKKITLVHDSVEWYSHQQFKWGMLAPAYLNKNILNRFLIDKTCRVITISKYLTEHFSSKGIDCVNIPIVTSDNDLSSEKELQETVQFTYAGQAGKKDYINVILSAMALLSDEERKKFKFNILGCSTDQIRNCGISEETFNKIQPCLAISGRVPRTAVLEQLKKTDFTILVRSPKQRYAKAGFPTKAVESLSRSTPMIANVTSDLGQYLVDGYNSFIVNECTAESLAVELRRALDLSLSERQQMCRNAYNTAAEKLHSNLFLNDLQKIIG